MQSMVTPQELFKPQFQLNWGWPWFTYLYLQCGEDIFAMENKKNLVWKLEIQASQIDENK